MSAYPVPANGSANVAERLYYGSAALEFQATVTNIRLVSAAQGGESPAAPLWQLALDRTAFYPEGGGQPFDTGVLLATAPSGARLQIPVERVEEDSEGEVWHYVRKPLTEGIEIEGRVDASRRLDHEQQHSGQHLLSAMFWREMKAPTISFHLGAESSTIDLDVAQQPGADQLRRVEEAANRVVYEQRPMIPHWVQPEFAEEMLRRGDLRKLPPRKGPLRIVQMQGIEFNACGGTHVRNTGEIGAVLIRRVEKVKGGWRVEFVCGGRAVRVANRDFALLSTTANLLSTSASELPARIATLLDENKAAAKAHKALLEELAESRARELASAVSPHAVLQNIFDGKDIDFAKRVASALSRSGHHAVIGVRHGDAGAVALALSAAPEQHAGNLLREVFSTTGARGGGSTEMAQGVCAATQVEGLVAAVAQHLSALGV